MPFACWRRARDADQSGSRNRMSLGLGIDEIEIKPRWPLSVDSPFFFSELKLNWRRGAVRALGCALFDSLPPGTHAGTPRTDVL